MSARHKIKFLNSTEDIASSCKNHFSKEHVELDKILQHGSHYSQWPKRGWLTVAYSAKALSKKSCERVYHTLFESSLNLDGAKIMNLDSLAQDM